MKTDFWAQLSRDDDTSHGTTRNSPAFSSSQELARWIREHRDGYDEVRAYERKITDGGFFDKPLFVEVEAPAEGARLADLVGMARETLSFRAEAAKTVRNQQARNAVELGKAAKARLDAAGVRIREQENQVEA